MAEFLTDRFLILPLTVPSPVCEKRRSVLCAALVFQLVCPWFTGDSTYKLDSLKEATYMGRGRLVTGFGTAGKDGGSVAAAVVDGALYAGRQEEEELGRTLLLARNKKTGKVRLLEVGSVSMKAVEQRAQPLSSQPGGDSLELSRKFGSKREKQKMEQRERLKVNAQTVNDQLRTVAEDTETINRLDLHAFSNTDSEDFYIPPINRSADNVGDVYEIGGILSPEQLAKIADEIESKDYKAELMPYVKTCTAWKKHWEATEVALILYVNSLLKLYLTMVKDLMKKGFKVCEVSPTINAICLDNFVVTTEGRRTRPGPYKDKALCHAIVALLLLNNFKFELAPFSAAVKIATATVVTKTRAVGAHVSSDKKLVVLKLPLNSAKSFVSRRKSARF